MRTHKYFLTSMVLALMLQACGNEAGVSTIPPVVVEPTAIQLTLTEGPPATPPVTEFFTPISVRSGFGFRGPMFELYFTDPANPFAQREVGGVDAIQAAAVFAAKESVDVALRYLKLDSLTKALLAVHRRGVAVRVITETESLTGRSDFQLLIDAGIPVIADQQPGLMNNRFIIIDRKEIWTGSLSHNSAGVFRENNTLVRIFSQEIVNNYIKEFDEMYTNNQFGVLVVPETPNPIVTLPGYQVETLFSPDDLVENRLKQLLGEAQTSIYFMAYSFSSTDLGNIIRERAGQGIQISGVLEFDLVDPNLISPNPNLLDELNLFRQAGLDIRLAGAPEVMNHKIMIIDGRIVVMGSYDFTNRAEIENDENVLIFHSEAIAQKFIEEFQRVQSRAQQ